MLQSVNSGSSAFPFLDRQRAKVLDSSMRLDDSTAEREHWMNQLKSLQAKAVHQKIQVKQQPNAYNLSKTAVKKPPSNLVEYAKS